MMNPVSPVPPSVSLAKAVSPQTTQPSSPTPRGVESQMGDLDKLFALLEEQLNLVSAPIGSADGDTLASSLTPAAIQATEQPPSGSAQTYSANYSFSQEGNNPPKESGSTVKKAYRLQPDGQWTLTQESHEGLSPTTTAAKTTQQNVWSA